MDRPLKFRAWDPVIERMWYSDEFMNVLPSGNESELQRLSGFFKKAGTYNLTVEQFTGIVDAKGKEIYVGDVIYTRNYHGDDVS